MNQNEFSMVRSTLAITVSALIGMHLIAPAMAHSREECSERWKDVELSGVAMSHGYMMGIVTIVVKEQAWEEMDYGQKSELADAYNCAIFGQDDVFAAIEFVSDMTNNRRGLWTEGEGLVVIER